MAGTFSTDLALIKGAEVLADYLAIGTFVYKATLSDDYKLEGTYCIVCSATQNLFGFQLAATPSADLNLSAAGTHVFAWVKNVAWASAYTKTSGGVGIAISSDVTPTAVTSVITAVVAAGGSGYSVNDVLTVVGGTGTAATCTVATLSGSAVATVTITTNGSYTVFPTSPVTTTVVPAGGTSCTLTLTSTGSVTNSKQWFLDGSDSQIVAGWFCYVVDVNGTPDIVTGTPAVNALDRIGIRTYNSGALTNKLPGLAFDISRYGTGSTINDGTGRAPVTMTDIVAWDNANTRAWGVAVQQESIYFIGGKLNFGTVAQSAETIFMQTNAVLVYHDFPVAAGFYEILINGASGQKTTFQLGNYNPASGLTSSGCTIKGSGNVSGVVRTDGVKGMAHSNWKLTASDANQVTKLYNSTFFEMLSAALAYNAVSIELTTNCTTNGTATLVTSGSYDTSGIVIGMKVTGTNISADTYVSSIQSATSLTMNKSATGSGSSLTMTFTHNNEIRGCTFSNFGAITTNGCVIDSCTFQDVKTGAPISSTYGLIVASATEVSRITNSKFINCNRAIKITATGTYTFSNLTFSGNTYDIENSSAGLVTVNLTNGSNASTYINTGGGTTNIVLSVTVSLTVVNESGTAIQGAQVYIQKSATGKTWNYTSHNTNNVAGDITFDVTEAVDADLPQAGWLHVWDASSNTKQNYRYQSWSTATNTTFTLNTEVTGTADAGGSSTTLIDAAGNFTVNAQEGDTIRNTTDTGAWAVVDEIVSGTELTTSPLQGGATNTWATGNAYSFHKLALTYANTDLVDIPIFNGQTNGSGVISTTYNYSAYSTSLPVNIRVRSNTGATKYIPYTTSGTITSTGYSGTVVLTQDTVAT